MKKIIIILLIAFFATSVFAKEYKTIGDFVEKPTIQNYIGKHIFVDVGTEYLYQGVCLNIGENFIIIRHISARGVEIMTIPIKNIKKFYYMEN